LAAIEREFIPPLQEPQHQRLNAVPSLDKPIKIAPVFEVRAECHW
jgi:hypothetical protein